MTIFWEMTSGIISVLDTLWFDSGYMFGVSLRGFLDVSPVEAQRQIPMVQTLLDHRVSPDRCPCLLVVQVLFPVFTQRLFPTVQTVVGPKRFPSSLTRWPISLMCGSCRFSGAAVEKTLCSHSCSSLRKSLRRLGRDVEAVSHVQAVLRAMDIPQLQLNDKVFDVPVCRLGSSA